MNYTSIEQSKKLLELGLKAETADACYDVGYGQTKAHIECENFTSYFTNDEFPELKDRYIPCWSLGALLELMPIIDDNSYSLSGTLNKGALCKHPCTSVMFQEESPLEAVYNMICWLLERNYIKKGE